MVVVFKDVTVLDVFTGTSKKGQAYGKVKLLTDDFEVFEIFFGASDSEKLSGIEPRTKVASLPFDMVAGYKGGVQLRPAW